MNRFCSSCGCVCEDTTATVCPVCGSPLPELPKAPEPPKKSHKTLWIILGIVGGGCLLLLILAIILIFLIKSWLGIFLGTASTPSVNIPGVFSTKDFHEYYYPDYDGATLNSEAFTETTTEMPSTEIPNTETPDTETSGTEMPDTELPSNEAVNPDFTE